MKTAIFNCLPKVISDCFVFPLHQVQVQSFIHQLELHFVIGPEKSHHHLSYLLAKLKPSQPGRPPFLALQQFGRFYFKVSLALNGISFLLSCLCRCDYFGFGFTTLNRKVH